MSLVGPRPLILDEDQHVDDWARGAARPEARHHRPLAGARPRRHPVRGDGQARLPLRHDLVARERHPADPADAAGAEAGVERVRLFGSTLHLLSSRDVVDTVRDGWERGDGGWILTVNLDILRRLCRDARFARAAERATLRVPDGMPVVWAGRLAGHETPERVAGADLLWQLSEAAAGGRASSCRRQPGRGRGDIERAARAVRRPRGRRRRGVPARARERPGGGGRARRARARLPRGRRLRRARLPEAGLPDRAPARHGAVGLVRRRRDRVQLRRGRPAPRAGARAAAGARVGPSARAGAAPPVPPLPRRRPPVPLPRPAPGARAAAGHGRAAPRSSTSGRTSRRRAAWAA